MQGLESWRRRGLIRSWQTYGASVDLEGLKRLKLIFDTGKSLKVLRLSVTKEDLLTETSDGKLDGYSRKKYVCKVSHMKPHHERVTDEISYCTSTFMALTLISVTSKR